MHKHSLTDTRAVFRSDCGVSIHITATRNQMGKKESKHQLVQEEIEDLRLTTEFNEEELRRWFKGFHEKCHKGKMSKTKFAEMYSKHFPCGDASLFAGHVFRTFDKNQDGYIDFREFIQGLSVISRGTQEQKLRWAFEMYDTDGGGSVDRKEMLEIVRSIFRIAGDRVNLPRDENTPEKFTHKLFVRLDRDNDGTITLDEFLRGAKCYPSFMKMLENPASVNQR